MQQTDISVLEQKIGYRFRNREYLREALTHSSYANEVKAKNGVAVCNERLEFLGDSVLSIVVSEYLFKKYNTNPEGELTQIRAGLVRSGTLASFAAKIGLGDFLYLGHGEEKNNGREKRSTLENAFEALLAAIYLDAAENGLDEIRRFLIPFVEYEIAQEPTVFHSDFKTELQQLIQQAEGDYLEYQTVEESGPDHAKIFTVQAKLNSNVIGEGKGKTKREAEQNAAREALKLFGQLDHSNE